MTEGEAMKCTWVDCPDLAEVPQTANDGEVWGNLCKRHDVELNHAVRTFDVKKVLSSWVKAQGGARGRPDRMMGKGRGRR